MFTVRTKYHTHANTGKGSITAKCNGKQRTVSYDHARGIQANHAAAAGAVLDVLTTSKQQAKLRHPSARQRVTVATFNNGTGVITVDV